MVPKSHSTSAAATDLLATPSAMVMATPPTKNLILDTAARVPSGPSPTALDGPMDTASRKGTLRVVTTGPQRTF